jgi:hypothetical protein
MKLAELFRAWLRFLDRQRRAMFDAPPSLDARRPATREMPSDHPLLAIPCLARRITRKQAHRDKRGHAPCIVIGLAEKRSTL